MTFSKYSTYKNRTSKAQAYQIYRLNKKINYIQNRTKPEVKIAPLMQQSINTAVVNTASRPDGIVLTNFVNEDATEVPAGSVKINGRFARMQSLKIAGTLPYTYGLIQ